MGWLKDLQQETPELRIEQAGVKTYYSINDQTMAILCRKIIFYWDRIEKKEMIGDILFEASLDYDVEMPHQYCNRKQLMKFAYKIKNKRYTDNNFNKKIHFEDLEYEDFKWLAERIEKNETVKAEDLINY